MSNDGLATDETKTTVENRVTWYLQDKLRDHSVMIATQKYLTSANLLVYLTRCNVAEPSVPRIKIQVLNRVEGGVHETGYQLYGDHRLERYENDMIFGAAADQVPTAEVVAVTEREAKVLLQLLDNLQAARPLP